MAPGVRCATILLELDLPFGAIVDGLMRELEMTADEATRATLCAAGTSVMRPH
jgi:hypothetical protein